MNGTAWDLGFRLTALTVVELNMPILGVNNAGDEPAAEIPNHKYLIATALCRDDMDLYANATS